MTDISRSGMSTPTSSRRSRAAAGSVKTKPGATSVSTISITMKPLRIFMFSGLAGADLNRRYLDHLGRTLLLPMLDEIRAERGHAPTPEDLWSLHGGIVYIGIRKHIYQVPVPGDPEPEIDRAIARFLEAESPSA